MVCAALKLLAGRSGGSGRSRRVEAQRAVGGRAGGCARAVGERQGLKRELKIIQLCVFKW